MGSHEGLQTVRVLSHGSALFSYGKMSIYKICSLPTRIVSVKRVEDVEREREKNIYERFDLSRAEVNFKF